MWLEVWETSYMSVWLFHSYISNRRNSSAWVPSSHWHVILLVHDNFTPLSSILRLLFSWNKPNMYFLEYKWYPLFPLSSTVWSSQWWCQSLLIFSTYWRNGFHDLDTALQVFLSLLRCARTGHSKLGEWRLISRTRISSGTLPRSQRYTAGGNEPICPSLLSARVWLKVVGDVLSPSDDIHLRTNSQYSQPSQEVTAVPLLETKTTAKRYPDALSCLCSTL